MTLELASRDVGEIKISYGVDVDAFTGAAGLRVAVPVPPGRAGLAPSLSLVYASGGGPSELGWGWSLAGFSSITVDTRRRLPRWDGSDPVQLDGDELVPWLERSGASWTARGHVDGDFTVTYLRGRRKPLHARVERWFHRPSGRIHFRVRDARNGVTFYGARPGTRSRLADPDDEARTFAWFPELHVDVHGNALLYEYAEETLDGVDRAAPFETRRPSLCQRYLKRIRYGNATPLAATDAVIAGALPPVRWCFQVVFDHGDHAHPTRPGADPDRAWLARRDPFTTCRTGFAVRTHRLVRRILSFHDFDELGPGPTLVGVLSLTHDESPAASTLREISYTGHRRDGSSKTIPPLKLGYAPAAAEAAFVDAPAETRENVPAGLGRRHAFVDLYGEGLPGILAETERAWYYKPNLGDGRFGAQTTVAERPMTRPGLYALGDVDADGDPDLSQLWGRLAGKYELARDERRWRAFKPFDQLPHVEALGGRAQWLDLNGDGKADVVVARAGSLVWYPSREDGFDPPVEVTFPAGARGVPLVSSELGLDLFFADMNGDGLPDLVRVRNGTVEYWPSLGNGRFGDVVVLEGAPQFDDDDEFDATRVRFVDVDGTGTADLVYLGRGQVSVWMNESGNRLSPGPRLPSLPYFGKQSTMNVLDFLGNGRTCLVWSTPLPGGESPIRYLPLTPEERPRLLLSVDDSLGQETRLHYGTSAAHYLRDLASGRDWSTRLPSHRAVVDRRETLDRIAGTRSVQRFEYHDAYHDGGERESRGFAQVDVFDLRDAGDDLVAFSPPSVTRLWFHIGTEMIGHQRPRRVYAGDALLPRLAPHVIEDEGTLATDELEDALRSLAGTQIRREIYAVDGSGALAAHPFEVGQLCQRVRRVQPASGDAPAAFAVGHIEDLSATYEQDGGGDPRIKQRLTIAEDQLDQPRRTASIAHARRAGKPRDVAAQDRHWITIHDHEVLHFDEPGRFELVVSIEGKTYELTGLRPGADGRFTRAQLVAPPVVAALASPAPHHVDQPDDPTIGARARLLSWDRTFYWNDARTAALPFGDVGATTLVHHDETACFAPDFVTGVLGVARASDSRLVTLGYAQHDGFWWKTGPVRTYTPTSAFSQRHATVRSDGATTSLSYDAYALGLVGVTDALGHATVAELDYHLLAPWRLTEPNGNVTEGRHDPLGVAVATTVRGHVGDEPWGNDPIASVVPRVPADLAAALADPAHLLQGASSYTWYDLDAWSARGEPTIILSLARADFVHDGDGGGLATGTIQAAVIYLDGFGRRIQEKSLVEPGPAIQRSGGGGVVVDGEGRPVLADAPTRWRASGHVVYDEKQLPGIEYEPFFTTTAAYEGDEVLRHVGVPLVTRYDALGRVVGSDLPNGTFTRTRIGAWSIEESDASDTVMESAYRAAREGRPLSDPERQALEQSKVHAATPNTTYLDPLGRDVAHLGRGGSTAPDVRVETHLDISGHAREVVDPRLLVAFSRRFDMLGRIFRETSRDAGDSFGLPDAHDRAAYTWTARGFEVERVHDVADRVRSIDVRGGDTVPPMDHRVEERVYGEDLGDPVAAAKRNLLGRVMTLRDAAGELRAGSYDPAGNSLKGTRVLRVQTDREPDWRVATPLESEELVSQLRYDALGRLRREIHPDGTIRTFEYHPGGEVVRMRVTTPGGALVDEAILDGTRFDARGQRELARLGNGVEVLSTYDPDTSRLARLVARRGSRRYLDLRYTYDAAGNIIRQVDDAQDTAGDAVVAGVTVGSVRAYTYDAHNRLRTATGRVHQALLEHDYVPGGAGTVRGTRHVSLSNGAAIERFTRTYDHDASGNLTAIAHTGATSSWTTAFWISTGSNRSLPAVDHNGIAVTSPETRFDAAGNLREVAHLRKLEWSWRNTLSRAVTIERAGSTDDGERYVYDGDGLRVRKIETRVIHAGVVEEVEKLSIGVCERKRIRRDGALILERWTTHLKDGSQRLATIHRWTRDDLQLETPAPATRLRYELAGHEGSTVVELDAAGNVLSYEEYFPYGGTAFAAGDLALKDVRHSAKERDDGTGLYYYGHRYYAPWMGRWLSPDPVGPEDDLNLYQFVHGNPIMNVDADGLGEEDQYVRVGSVRSTTAAAVMREWNNSQGILRGVEVTRVRRLPNGDWLIVESRPIPPEVLEIARRGINDLGAARSLATMISVLGSGNPPAFNSPAPGEEGGGGGGGNAAPPPGQPPAVAGGNPGTGGPGGQGGQAAPEPPPPQQQPATGNTPGAGGLGVQGTGPSDRTVGNEGPTVARPPADPGNGGSGHGEGSGPGHNTGEGTGRRPSAPRPENPRPNGGGGPGGRSETPGGTAPEGRGHPQGQPGGHGSNPPVTGGTGGQGLADNGQPNGGGTDPRLTPSATGQPPPPGVTKQGTDPNGSPNGSANGVPGANNPNGGQPDGGAPANHPVVEGGSPGGSRAGHAGGGPGGDPNTRGGDGVPGGRGTERGGAENGHVNGAPGGGGDWVPPSWAAPVLRVLPRVLQFVGGLIEFVGGLAMLIAPEPAATKVAGAFLVWHGFDTMLSAITGERTLTARGVERVARFAGASPETARTIGDVADVVLPLVAGGVGALGKTGALGATRTWGWTQRIPGARWFMQGHGNDAILRGLSKADRKLYELGQRTLTNRAFNSIPQAIRTEQSVTAGIARGRFIQEQIKAGWRARFAYRTSYWSMVRPRFEGWRLRFGTLGTGPTPEARYWLPVILPFFGRGVAEYGQFFRRQTGDAPSH